MKCNQNTSYQICWNSIVFYVKKFKLGFTAKLLFYSKLSKFAL